MKRLLLTTLAVLAFGSLAAAQPTPLPPIPIVPPPPGSQFPPADPVPPPPPPAVYQPNVYVPPDATPGPAIPMFKSGGVVVGAYGFYPYDTGAWLLGGFQGLTRQTGSFTMVYPSVPEPADGAAPAAPAKHSWRLFKHKSSCPTCP